MLFPNKLRFAELESRAEDKVSSFSGGMKRRLNLVIGLLHSPQLVLMDEPTVGVDPQSRNHLFESIESLRKKRDVRSLHNTLHGRSRAAV